MFRLAAFSLLAAVLLCGTAAAQDDGFGLGVILGEPTGGEGQQAPVPLAL